MDSWWQSTFPQGRQTLHIQDANGRNVAIAYGTAGEGQPLLLLHGIGSWSYSWRKSVAPLSRYFRVICPDAKGHGFSQAAPENETVGHQIVELAQIITTLSDRPAIVVGESMGALTALAVAETQPELIDRLVLINAPVFPQQLPSWGMRWLSYLPLELVQLVEQFRLAQPLAPAIREITRIAREEVVVNPAEITSEEIYWLTYPYIYRSGPLTQFAVDLQQAAQEINRLQQNQPNLIRQIQDDLVNVSCPSLILWADQDRWFPQKDGEMLHARLPHSRLQIIPNCGHNASGSNPTAVNTAILQFLAETSDRQA
ncbi:alpha/beta hydrolase [Oculatella sp. LEGE 06141]|uniref:alpha/beta fold hydrolase n=1 Tax=Oculatella sp. LEGE 06141 TaxID=1828648 RepID=UPI0018807EA2|nr:alpha/beta hydrolase [Oculatella sp. LEGE 06141]MBE9177821.1 alpha/beta hydrolase [Oculatella sp. LEGE 06141]